MDEMVFFFGRFEKKEVGGLRDEFDFFDNIRDFFVCVFECINGTSDFAGISQQ